MGVILYAMFCIIFVLFYAYRLIVTINAVTYIREYWCKTGDRRFYTYNFDDMILTKDNWYGLRDTEDWHY